ncbi:hypothetical protein AHAS_Ahas09G0183300 [Arachis hypogaea]|uniref:Uncharacterized protein n=1 Tax=Arachis hypogaea TaxID=3818 RepID=A0A445BHR7_ARAHY|nr:hypothetical protein Ahy_A09g043132 [Arachis hypogaea]
MGLVTGIGDPSVIADGEFVIEMEFSSRETMIITIKDYMIHRGVDYRVYESEPTLFYTKYELCVKVQYVIVDVQAKFNYTMSYRKTLLVKQKVVEKIFGDWETSYKALQTWFKAMCKKEPLAVVQFETVLVYRGHELVQDI